MNLNKDGVLCRVLITSYWKHHIQTSNIVRDTDKWPNICMRENNGGIQNDVPSGTAKLTRMLSLEKERKSGGPFKLSANI